MSDGQRLRRAFVQNLPVVPDDIDEQRLTEELLAVTAAARAAWPAVDLDRERYVAFVAERISWDGSVIDGLQRTRTTDLWLACGCAAGDPLALAAFEAAYGPAVDAALAAQGVPRDVADEARQVVRTRLFVAAPGTEPVIARYSGRGDLRAWVRATTVRAAIDLIRRARREVPEDQIEPDAPVPALDPELRRLRDQYGEQFKAAFAQAFAALSKRDRTILRYRFVDGLDIDALGAVYRVHRSTAARWLHEIRQRLRDETLDRLSSLLAVSIEELSSLLRLIGSQLDVSISTALHR